MYSEQELQKEKPHDSKNFALMATTAIDDCAATFMALALLETSLGVERDQHRINPAQKEYYN